VFGLVGEVGEGLEGFAPEGRGGCLGAGGFDGSEGRELGLDVGVGDEGCQLGGGEVVEGAELAGGDGMVCELEGEAVGQGQVVAFEEVGHAGIVADGRRRARAALCIARK